MLSQTEIQFAINSALDDYLPLLHVAENGNINPRAALMAIAHVESGFGKRYAASKHENAYCYGGVYYRGDGPAGRLGDDVLRRLTWTWGCSAHESFGPWQILFISAHELGYNDDPLRLREPRVSLPYVIALLNKRVMDRLDDETQRDIFDAYNSGNPRDGIVPQDYINKVQEHYRRLV